MLWLAGLQGYARLTADPRHSVEIPCLLAGYIIHNIRAVIGPETGLNRPLTHQECSVPPGIQPRWDHVNASRATQVVHVVSRLSLAIQMARSRHVKHAGHAISEPRHTSLYARQHYAQFNGPGSGTRPPPSAPLITREATRDGWVCSTLSVGSCCAVACSPGGGVTSS